VPPIDTTGNNHHSKTRSGEASVESAITHHDKGLLIRDLNKQSLNRTSELDIEALERADVGYRYLLGEWVDT
jgi:hypothetical protein